MLATNKQRYLYKLVETFNECEDLEDLEGLHRLSSIMKTLSSLACLSADSSSDKRCRDHRTDSERRSDLWRRWYTRMYDPV